MPGRGPGSRTGKPCQDHLGQAFKSKAEMCRHWGVSQVTFATRRRKGLSLEQALASPAAHGPGHPCTDHKGITYPSMGAMFRAYNINYTVYHYRHDVKGWDMQKSLETPVQDTDLAGAHECEDHLGNKFPSKKAMCEYWHVPRNVFFVRKKQGCTLEECLAPVDESVQTTPVTDHEGRQFRNLDEMCSYWDIAKSDYIQNIRNNLPLSRALVEKTKRPKHPKDHLGQEYPSINAMCKAWGITKTTLRSRLELGWTLSEILTHPENNSHLIPCTDHLGNQYPSQRAMLKAWNVTHSTYKHRLKKGRSLQEALDPGSLHARPMTDHEGREFPCLQAMLDYWSALTANYHHRAQTLGLDLETALTKLNQGQVLPCGIKIVKIHENGWHEVEIDGKSAMLSKGQILHMARSLLLQSEINDGTLPDGMHAAYLLNGWFQVWGTDRTGPAPGVLLSADTAWLERCLYKYRQKPKKSIR